MRQATLAPADQVSANADRVQHFACPYCFVAPLPGAPLVALCGLVAVPKALRLTDADVDGIDCPLCVDVFATVQADQACRRCP